MILEVKSHGIVKDQGLKDTFLPTHFAEILTTVRTPAN